MRTRGSPPYGGLCIKIAWLRKNPKDRPDLYGVSSEKITLSMEQLEMSIVVSRQLPFFLMTLSQPAQRKDVSRAPTFVNLLHSTLYKFSRSIQTFANKFTIIVFDLTIEPHHLQNDPKCSQNNT